MRIDCHLLGVGEGCLQDVAGGEPRWGEASGDMRQGGGGGGAGRCHHHLGGFVQIMPMLGVS